MGWTVVVWLGAVVCAFWCVQSRPGNKGGAYPLFFAVRAVGLVPAGRVLAWAGVVCACGRVRW